VHTGDFKLDYTPVSGKPTDLSRLAQVGSQGVFAVTIRFYLRRVTRLYPLGESGGRITGPDHVRSAGQSDHRHILVSDLPYPAGDRRGRKIRPACMRHRAEYDGNRTDGDRNWAI